jgi:hypothetical protein
MNVFHVDQANIATYLDCLHQPETVVLVICASATQLRQHQTMELMDHVQLLITAMKVFLGNFKSKLDDLIFW